MEKLAEGFIKKEQISVFWNEMEKKVLNEIEQLKTKIDIKKIKETDYMGYLAVDSAFVIKDYLYTSCYYCVAVSLSDDQKEDMIMDVRDIIGLNYDIDCAVESEPEHETRLLEGMALTMESSLLEKYSRSYPLVFIDNSIVSVIIKLNSFLTYVLNQNNRKKSKLIDYFAGKYDEIINSVYNVLKRKNFIACPKRSGRTELINYLEQQGFSNFGINNDLFIANYLLNAGEYISLPIQQNKYNLAGNNDKKNSLFEIINSCKVYYLKGASGKIFKFEVSGDLPADVVYPYTLSKELVILEEVDRRAKTYLNILMQKQYLYEEDFR